MLQFDVLLQKKNPIRCYYHWLKMYFCQLYLYLWSLTPCTKNTFLAVLYFSINFSYIQKIWLILIIMPRSVTAVCVNKQPITNNTAKMLASPNVHKWSIHFLYLIQFRVTFGLESIPAVTGWPILKSVELSVTDMETITDLLFTVMILLYLEKRFSYTCMCSLLPLLPHFKDMHVWFICG